MARIAVLEDSDLMLNLLRRLLEEAGHEVLTWGPTSTAEFTQQIEAGAPDLLLTDYQMPGFNGLTAIRLARKVLPGLPVVVLTAIPDLEVHHSLEKIGVWAILHKPLSNKSLVEKVAEALAH